MKVQTQTASIAAPTPLRLRIWRNQTLRTQLFMLMRIGLFVLAMIMLGRAMDWLLPLPKLGVNQLMALSGSDLWLQALRRIVPPLLAYWLLVRLVERRRMTELAPGNFARHGAGGWLLGTGLMLLVAAILAALGAYQVAGINSGVYLIGPLVVFGLVPGIIEEIIARGVVFRMLEDGLGSWIALAISAAVFGYMHMGNPNATVLSSMAIAIEAGLLLGMAYAWTRSLWFCMALHGAWNFTQGPLLGIRVSGFEVGGLLDSSIAGPAILSGGEFGAEASIVALFAALAMAGYFTRKAIQQGKIRAPAWQKRVGGS